MKWFRLLTIASLIVLSASCKEEEDKEDPKINISGFTERDGNGQLSGNVDPADWGFNTTFNGMEQKLFPTDELSICGDHADTSHKLVLYPNPNDGIFVLASQVPNERISIRIVDEYLKVLYKNDSVTSSALTISENKESGRRKVRMYYTIYNDSCKYQGYGDISIK